MINYEHALSGYCVAVCFCVYLVWCKYSNEPYDVVGKRYYGPSLSAMNTIIQPFHLLVIALAGWLNRDQQALIDYLVAENRVLKDQLGGRRPRFTDEQRIRLAVKAKVVGCRLLDEIETLVTPDTLLAWHRTLVANKWTVPRKSRADPALHNTSSI